MHPLPEQFADISLTALPDEERPALLHALDRGKAARGLRLRPGVPLKTVEEALPGCYTPVPWALSAFYIDADLKAGVHPLHAAGAYYLQEPSAMAAVGALGCCLGQRVLDLCAAPGGKSTQIAALMAGEGVLVANEIVPSRAKVLSQNIERMGVTNAVVVCEQPDKLAARWGAWFDRVLVDAPCSGEGMFRRDPDTRTVWTPQTAQGCAARQLRILKAAAMLLRPGGTIVYSTCTYNEIENEQVIEAFVAAHPSFSIGGIERLWPHRVRGEGHFVAKLIHGGKSAMDTSSYPRRERIELGEYIREFDGISLLGHAKRAGETVWALPAQMPPLDGIRALRTGLALGMWRGKHFMPDHALALALSEADRVRAWPVDDDAAARFLSGEPLPANGMGKGWVIVTHRGLGIGWAKCTDGILKNHVPKGLRQRR